jgi:ORF6N domain-containing protein
MKTESPCNFMDRHTSRGGSKSALISRERIEQTILVTRGHRVMLDADLAKLYGVTTFNLNKAVRRNSDRFSDDFMFRLSTQETAALTFQIGISKPRG